MIRKLALFAALVGIASDAPCAQASSATRDLLQVTLDNDALSSLPGRKRLIAAVGAYCAEVRALYPRNSPAEDQWLASEVTGGGDRPERAVASAEFGRRRTALFVDGCARWKAEFEIDPSHGRAFIGLAYTFVRLIDDSTFYARKNNIDPDQLGFPFALRSGAEALLLAALLSSP